jgi:Zn-dependent peptidase ImmA (M78 family)
VPGPVRDPRADALRRRYHEFFGGEELPVPVELIAEDLLGLAIHEGSLDGLSGVLYPEERQIHVNESDSAGRRRFTIAHELGHWVCQCLDGRGETIMCRSEDVTPQADRTLEREANVFGAELLMPEEAVREHATDQQAPALFRVSNVAFQWRLYSFDLGERPA